MVSCGAASDISITSKLYQVIKLPLLAAYLIKPIKKNLVC